MKERPIIFNGDMVCALLAGRKTQTRRPILKAIDEAGTPAGAVCPAAESGWIAWWPGTESNVAEFTKRAYREGFPCPYGQPGDRLWVRESWWVVEREGRGVGRQFVIFDDEWSDHFPNESAPLRHCFGQRWGHRPSIHMPRWASRLTLEITDVRVQRLREITEADANVEGCLLEARDQDWTQCRRWFQQTWNSIYAKRGLGWDANPWVWAITFTIIP